MAQIGQVIEGKYEVLKEIGRGGMSIVYLAMDTHLNKQWAIKEIKKSGKTQDDELCENSLLAEANMIKTLEHPALPRIVDIIDNGETIFIIMDYIEGDSLDKVLNEHGAQSEDLVIAWAKQICDALSYLHSRKPPIIYRDMKPANVMLKPEGNIKIIDFGIAREYKEQSLADTTMLGTKGYAPPEQYGGQTDARSDIFALGMTMHHLLTGVDPRSQPYTLVREWNPELSEGIEIIIDKCVEPAAENRYQNCADLLYDLEHPELITKGFKQMQRRKLISFVVSVAICIVMAITGFICDRQATRVNNNTYDNLISVADSTSLEDKMASYKQAIAIYPYDTRAYVAILEAYESEGRFSKSENDQFLALYNANKDGFDTTTVEVAELNYQIGMMYFNYYTDEDGSASFSNRVQKAHSFFSANYDNSDLPVGFEKRALSDCYYQICTFYKKYILNSATVEEASKESYNKLFETIEEALNDVKDASPYDQLTLYNGTFMLLFDQRSNMASVNVEQSAILDLLETVYSGAKNLTVQKEQSKNLQQEIIDNYEDYKTAIERTYANLEERG